MQSSRIGLYHALVVKPVSEDRRVVGADTGWMTYLFEMYGVPYYLLTDAEVKAGNLRDRFDVIILPDEGVGAMGGRGGEGRGGGGAGGRGPAVMPPGYDRDLGPEGAASLKKFVEEGGTLVCNKASSNFAITTFNLPVKNVLANVSPEAFSCPGSLLNVNYDTGHPVAYGMKDKGICFFGAGMAFDVQSAPDSPIKVVATYSQEKLLASGWLVGGEKMQGKAAVLDAAVGKGKVVLFGFNVTNRAQLYATVKLLLNSAYYR